jgi:4,5-DOPA dioxygenase extradiol
MTQPQNSRFPVLFIGHGSPMNALEDNSFARTWRDLAVSLPRPRAILCISAHWETHGAFATAMEQPQTIHDFGGFPAELYEMRYPAPGDPQLARECQGLVASAGVGLDQSWGLDHGAWSVLCRMYPAADIPVVQLSLDRSLSADGHYGLAQELAPLREKGVLIIGSGNMVHNLGMMMVQGSDFNAPFGFDWAVEANELFKKLILERQHAALIDYRSLGRAARLAIPTSEHFLPLLYAVALQREDETVAFFNDAPVAGSLTMTSFIIR